MLEAYLNCQIPYGFITMMIMMMMMMRMRMRILKVASSWWWWGAKKYLQYCSLLIKLHDSFIATYLWRNNKQSRWWRLFLFFIQTNINTILYNKKLLKMNNNNRQFMIHNHIYRRSHRLVTLFTFMGPRGSENFRNCR